MTSKSGKKITGFHATLFFVAFFGVIAAVNFLMAGFAISSFGGTVVDNSYVASQKYNDWLQQGRSQAAHGWTVTKPMRVNDRLKVGVGVSDGQPLSGANITAIAEHPVGRADAFNLSFSEIAPGQYQSVGAVPSGRWKLKLSVTHQGKEMRKIGEIR